MTPRILISGCDESRFNYENAVRQAGGEAFSYYCPEIDSSYDGLLLCGGNDIDPGQYGQDNCGSVEMDCKRDQIEIALVKKYAESGKPILGICRGMQIINVAMGGDMIQDLSDRLKLFHSAWKKPDYKVHPVCCRKGSDLDRFYGGIFTVNSCHHQAIGRMGNGLRAAAWSEGGVIEALDHESLPIRGVQWHPERMCFTNRRADTVDGAPVFDWLIMTAKS